MEYKCVGEEVRVVSVVNRLQAGLSSSSQFQLQSGLEPEWDSFHLRRRVVDSASFIENLGNSNKTHVRHWQIKYVLLKNIMGKW